MRKRLLLNWLYYRPVGHAIEALKLAKGYSLANKDVDVHVILNADTPVELAQSCSWIKNVYPVSLDDIKRNGAKSLQRIPRTWDYISTDKRVQRYNPAYDDPRLIKAHRLLDAHLHAKIAKGYVEQGGSHETSILPVIANPKITLSVPKDAKLFARRFRHRGPKICIMLGGSSGEKRSPSIHAWLKICLALSKSIPRLKIYFTGISGSVGNRTTTKDFTLDDVAFLKDRLPDAEIVYDAGLWRQIALIERCDIFLSPHTGFAFIPQLVGTPWLEIAACPWPAYLFNDVPFYSALPKCGAYPSYANGTTECSKLLSKGRKTLCISDEQIARRIPEIVKGARLLLTKEFTYERAVALHLKKIKKDYTLSQFFFFGGLEGITHNNR